MSLKQLFNKLVTLSRKIKNELVIFKKVLKDKRTPLLPKILLGSAMFYLLLPFDIIPDFVPFLGQIDDIIIVPLLIYIAIRLLPKEIIEEYNLKST